MKRIPFRGRIPIVLVGLTALNLSVEISSIESDFSDYTLADGKRTSALTYNVNRLVCHKCDNNFDKFLKQNFFFNKFSESSRSALIEDG